MSTRADLVDTGHRWRRAGTIVINAPIQQVFDIIADPYRHAEFDGSGTVKKALSGPHRLSEGTKFGMDMKMGLRYRMKNTVVEYSEPNLIAWCHPGHHRWRYELTAIDENTTEVTETFDGSTARFPPALKAMNAYENNQKAILKTLVRLKELAESEA
jgi:uncharacterized protein YndB with AHSA1/START domain